MCLSDEIDDKWGPFIEFMIFIVFQGYNVGAHYGIWVVTQTKIVDQTTHAILRVNKSSTVNSSVSSNLLTTTPAALNNTILNSSFGLVANATNFDHKNVTVTPEEIWEDLIKFRQIFFYMCIFGTGLFAIQFMLLLPNVVKHFFEADVATLKDESAPWYFRNVFLLNVMMLVFTSIAFDIPIAVLTIRLLEDIWRGDALTEAEKLDVSNTMVTLSLSGLAFIALYKGMMPLFLWVGNPFCFPCVPLRMLIVLPGGLVSLVMTFAPPMGYAKHSLLTFAPESMQQQLGDLANTFFSIGMIFWGVFFVLILVISICYYKFCYDSSSGGGCCCCC